MIPIPGVAHLVQRLFELVRVPLEIGSVALELEPDTPFPCVRSLSQSLMTLVVSSTVLTPAGRLAWADANPDSSTIASPIITLFIFPLLWTVDLRSRDHKDTVNAQPLTSAPRRSASPALFEPRSRAAWSFSFWSAYALEKAATARSKCAPLTHVSAQHGRRSGARVGDGQCPFAPGGVKVHLDGAEGFHFDADLDVPQLVDEEVAPTGALGPRKMSLAGCMSRQPFTARWPWLGNTLAPA